MPTRLAVACPWPRLTAFGAPICGPGRPGPPGRSGPWLLAQTLDGAEIVADVIQDPALALAARRSANGRLLTALGTRTPSTRSRRGVAAAREMVHKPVCPKELESCPYAALGPFFGVPTVPYWLRGVGVLQPRPRLGLHVPAAPVPGLGKAAGVVAKIVDVAR